jgi:chromosome partitioning protein
LKEILAPHLSRFDFILIDCSPSLGLTSLNALTTADSFIIPVLPHPLSIKGLANLISVTNKIKSRLNEKLELEGILVTHYNNRTVIHKNIYDSLHKHFNEALYKTTIRKNIALVEASFHGQSIYEYSPQSHGAQDYQAFCEEFLLKNKV